MPGAFVRSCPRATGAHCAVVSLAIVNGLTLFAGLAHAQPVDVQHSFSASLQPGGTLRQSPHPNVVVFTGVTPVPLETTSTPTGPVTNPVYSDKGLGGSNPIYSGLINQPTFDPFEDADFATIEVSCRRWVGRRARVSCTEIWPCATSC